jgi:hypothetical protein
VGGQQRLTRHLWPPGAVAQDKVRQDREDRLTGGALEAPDGEPAQADPRVMRVARQAPTRAAAGLVEELKAKSEKKRKHELDKRCGVAQERKVGCLIAEVDSDRAVVAYRFGGGSPVLIPRSDAIGVEEDMVRVTY